MKKLLALILLLGCLVNSFALADSFTLRNGVLFGDTMETIKGKEDLKYVNEGKDSMWFRGVIANISGSEVVYYFDEEGKLKEMQYSLGAFSSISVSDYDILKEGLTNKYGPSLGFSNGKTSALLGHELQYLLVDLYKTEAITGGSHKLINYEEWIVPCDEGTVKIELVYYTTDGNWPHVAMSYGLFSDAEVQEAMDEAQQQKDSFNNDI